MKHLQSALAVLALTLAASAAHAGHSTSGGTLVPMGESVLQIQAILRSNLIAHYPLKIIRRIQAVGPNQYVVEVMELDGSGCVAEPVTLRESSPISEAPDYAVIPAGAVMQCSR
jgi:hypothetical protein